MVDESVVFDRAAGYYDDTRGFPPGEDRNVAAFMAQAAGLMGDERVLEIGVGTGRIAIPLSAHSGRYTGLDLSALMMQRLREKESSDGRVHLTQGDALRLPLAPESFDVAVIVHVLHLVPDRAQVIAELARVLRPGGRVLQARNQRGSDQLEPLWQAWETATQNQRQMQPRWQQANHALTDYGWTATGEEHTYAYTSTITPDEMANRYRQRVWSKMWHMDDAVWETGVAAVEAALKAHYPDPHAPLQITNRFLLRVFTRPV